MATSRHSVLSEGTDAGFLGGTVVAVWFLLRDLLLEKPLLTPSVLGQLVFFGNHTPNRQAIDFGATLLYTVFHFAIFVAFGLVVALLVRLAVEDALVRFALLVLFVVFEVFFYVVIRLVATEVGSLFPAFWVLSANLVAALVMGAYFWRRYPELRETLRHEPLGA